MPAVDDYDPEEDDAAGGGGRRITGGGGGNQTAAQPSAQVESQHVGWDRFINANADVAEREANKLQSQVQGSVDKATQGRDAAVAQQAAAIGSNYSQPAAPKAFGSVAKQPSGEPSNPSAFGSKMSGPPLPQAPPATQSIAAPPASDVMNRTAFSAQPAVKGVIDPNKLKTDTSTGKPVTSAFGVNGASDLKGTLGDAGWSALMGDTMKAGQEADALGSTSGVQALLGQQATGFDAGLIGGAGGKDFRDLASKYGGNQLGGALQNANKGAVASWEQLMGDLEGAGLSRDREIQTANDEMNALAALDQQRAAKRAEADKAMQWVKSKFPVAPQFESRDGFLGWAATARSSGNGRGNMQAWAEQIYGKGDQAAIDQLFTDIQRMTPEEYEAFKYGVVPAWMGNGSAASVGNGGKFGGLGNTGDRVTGETTNTPTEENAQDWNNKQEALKAYYEALAAIAMAGV